MNLIANQIGMKLTPTQLETLTALIDVLIPPDEDPGAHEASVEDYILRQLQGDLAELLPTYRQGLDALETEASAVFGAKFTELDLARQTELLTRLETGLVEAEWTLPPADFIGMAAHHTAEGFYADPGNGGNRNEVSWRMIGFKVTA